MGSYTTIVAGLHERFATITGIAVILDYEPKTIHATPTLYTLLDSFNPEQRGQIKLRRYRILHRLVFKWLDNEQAEQELMPFVDSVPASVRADPHLGGRITSGVAVIEEGFAVFVVIGGTMYRALDFYSSVLDKSQ